ncbi:sorbitol dehydrogenase-like [Oppia nitens]|uniref:sorbitol dehydrogenase-like n=1 Tax=Oppia nitens TaxID=1686743 RepID=UPI0023DCE0B3|nr:sorbitol dehydrogenase-like [Oppia nitens]
MILRDQCLHHQQHSWPSFIFQNYGKYLTNYLISHPIVFKRYIQLATICDSSHIKSNNKIPQPKTNISAVLHKVNDLRLEDKPIPPMPGPNELLLRTLCVGICGSDVHYWKHGFIGNFVLKNPIIMGHETSAQVAAVGSGVKNFKVGDRVCCEPAVSCRLCAYCKDGQYNLCDEILCHATPPYDGTLTQYFIHPADFTFKLPDNITDEEGAMIEPLSVALYAAKRAGVEGGSAVMVTGAGPIGLFQMMISKAFGSLRVIVLDTNMNRLKLAKSICADEILQVHKDGNEEQLIQTVHQLMGKPIDITLECSGAPKMVRLAMLSTKDGGTVLLTGHGPKDMNLPMSTAAIREVTVMGSFRYRNCFPLAIQLVSSGKVQLKPLISHRFPFKQTLDAFNVAFKGEGVKVIIRVNEIIAQ